MAVIAVQGEVNENLGIYTGGLSNNYINGDEDPNHIVGNTLVDAVYGFGGNDIISGGGGNDLLHGGMGQDSITGDEGDDQIYGEEGDDDNQAGRSGLLGGDGDDYINGGDGNDYLEGNNNSDQLYGGAGNDKAYGGDGNDYLFGEAGNDILDGGAGSDYVFSGAGDDTVYGGQGDDHLNLGEGNDYADAGAGNDYIMGGSGDNEVYGGDGDDVIRVGDGDIIDGGVGGESRGDMIIFEFSDYPEGIDLDLNLVIAQDLDRRIDTIKNFTITNIENVHGTKSDDKLIGDAENNILVGSLGADILYGGNDGVDMLDPGGEDLAQDIAVVGVGGRVTIINFEPAQDIVGLDAASCGAGLDGGTLALGVLAFEEDIGSITAASTGLIYIGDVASIGTNSLIRCVLNEGDSKIYYDADGDWADGYQGIANIYLYEGYGDVSLRDLAIHGYDISTL